jgi:hypothetical protein
MTEQYDYSNITHEQFKKKPDFNFKILKINKEEILCEATTLNATINKMREQKIEINDKIKEYLRTKFPLLSENLNGIFLKIIETDNFKINILVEMINGIYTIGENHSESAAVRYRVAEMLNKIYIESKVKK